MHSCRYEDECLCRLRNMYVWLYVCSECVHSYHHRRLIFKTSMNRMYNCTMYMYIFVYQTMASTDQSGVTKDPASTSKVKTRVVKRSRTNFTLIQIETMESVHASLPFSGSWLDERDGNESPIRRFQNHGQLQTPVIYCIYACMHVCMCVRKCVYM